eukprot:PhM_4_TR9964/c0_g1_i1/m.17517
MNQLFRCQIVCEGCSVILGHELGAAAVRCPRCDKITVVMQLQMKCPRCESQVLLPSNTTRGLCPCCTTVIDIAADKLPLPGRCRRIHSSSQDPGVQRVVVFIENPKTRGDDGRERECTRLGTKMSGGGGDK